MKWFTAIWAFYLMVLSIVPCSDAHNLCNTTQATMAAEQTHRHDQDKDDICTPFCHCSCCSVSIAILTPGFPGENRHAATYVDNKIFIHDFSFLSGYYGNIWQPPKINA
jgi:hypothetical protein